MLFRPITRIFPNVGSPQLFDAQLIQRRHETAIDRSLFRYGGAIISTMRRLIRFRRGPSAAGNPPHAHVRGRGGIRYLRFRVNRFNKSVIAGPVRNSAAINPDGKPAPETLDKGGVIKVDPAAARAAAASRRASSKRATATITRNSAGTFARIKPRPIRQPTWRRVRSTISLIYREEMAFRGF